MSNTASGTGNEPHIRSDWKINRAHDEHEPYRIIIHEGPVRVALVYKQGNDVYFNERIADQYAELIVRAVNSHDKLVEAASKLLEAMEQKQFFMSGYAQGSASISEVNNASDEEHKAYSELWNIIHELKKS